MENKNNKRHELSKKVPNRFLLCVAAAKRARQIKEGAIPLVEQERKEPLPVLAALDELVEDKLSIIIQEQKTEEEELDDEIAGIVEAQDAEDAEKAKNDEPKKDKKPNKKKSLAA